MRKSHFTLLLIALSLLVIGLSVSWTAHHESATDKNKALVDRFYEEVFNQHNVDAAGEFIATDAVSHASPPGAPGGLEGAKQMFTMFFATFPDLKVTAKDMIAEGDKVAIRYTMTGTHKGDFMGIAATGKTVTITGIEIVRVAEGKVVEHWDASDMMQQLGGSSMPGGPAK